MNTNISYKIPYIIYIDINSCFASAIQQAFRHLRGKPVAAVSYETPRGCILSPSIEAKKYGICTGMRVYEAQRLCPDLLYKIVDTTMVRDIHIKLRKICSNYSYMVSPQSIDEFIIDVSPFRYTSVYPAIRIAYKIKQSIRKEIGKWIRVSIGISVNQFLAKLASTMKKPNGLYIISHKNLIATYKKISLRDLPGINTQLEKRLFSAGITTVYELFSASSYTLKKKVFYSIEGYYWYLRLRGWEVDNRVRKRKSFGQEYCLGKTVSFGLEFLAVLETLTEKMCRRMRSKGYAPRTIGIILSFVDGSCKGERKTYKKPLYNFSCVFRWLRYISRCLIKKKKVKKIRIYAVNLVKDDKNQLTLFHTTSYSNKKNISDIVNYINDKYGEGAVVPAVMLSTKKTIHDRISFGTTINGSIVHHQRNW